MRKIHRAALVAASLTLAGMGFATPMGGRLFVKNVSPSMELGWYVRTNGDIAEGAIVAFMLPDGAREIAEAKGVPMDIPIMKRVIAIDRGRAAIVAKGDMGGTRSFDSTYYGPVPIGNVVGVYTKL